MDVTSGLAPFRGILDMNIINHTQYCTYNINSSKWETYSSEYAETISEFATDWYVNLGNYKARVVFDYTGEIKFYVEGSSIRTISTDTDVTVTDYGGILPHINLNLDSLGFASYSSYCSSDNPYNRLCMRFEEVKDSYVIVRYDCSSTKYPNYPFWAIEVTVYSDGTVLINQSSNTRSHTVSVYNYNISYHHNVVKAEKSVSGRRSIVLVLDTDNTEVIGWKTTYFTTSNYQPSDLDLKYTPTYSVAICQKDPVTGNTVIPKYHGLRDKSDTSVSLDVNDKKLFVGNIKGNKKFLVGESGVKSGNTLLKFGYKGNVYTVTDNSNGGSVYMANFTRMGGRTYSRFYTHSSRWWNNLSVNGCELGYRTRKIIVFYEVYNSTSNTEYTQYLPNSGSPHVYLFYKTNNINTNYGGWGQDGWDRVELGEIPFTSDNPWGRSGSFVYEFSSPVDIYELTVCPLASGGTYTNSFVDHIILI